MNEDCGCSQSQEAGHGVVFDLINLHLVLLSDGISLVHLKQKA